MAAAIDYISAEKILLKHTKAVDTETVCISEALDRVLAAPLVATENVPGFDRSPYDGYAFRAEDTLSASKDAPVTFIITEEIAAGSVPSMPITEGIAAKVLTGAPIPEGADAVIKYEDTEFDEREVKIFSPVKSGSNIVYAGEDFKKGQVLAESGSIIDAGLLGTFASLGTTEIPVYKKPLIGIISTGNEVVEPGDPLPQGGIYDSNRYLLESALKKTGCETRFFGTVRDDVSDIEKHLSSALEECSAVVLTGGASVGDYDLTPEAMRRVGTEILVNRVAIKPGMACAYGVRDDKLVIGLSGNPASSITNFYAIVLPAIKKLCGVKNPEHEFFDVRLADGFVKKSRCTRFLRGRLDLSDGTARMRLTQYQGNAIISSMIGSNMFAVVPAGSGAIEEGTVLKGFLI